VPRKKVEVETVQKKRTAEDNKDRKKENLEKQRKRVTNFKILDGI
jgi:hypothetical protein